MEIIYIYKLSKVKWAVLASSSSETIMNYWISHLFFIVIDIINIFAWKHPDLHRHRSIYEPVLFTAVFYSALSTVEGKQREKKVSPLMFLSADTVLQSAPSLQALVFMGHKIKFKKYQGANGMAEFTIFLTVNSWTTNKSAVLQTEVIPLSVTQSSLGFKLPPDQLWKS